MAIAYHSQQSLLGGIRESSAETSEQYFTSLADCSNFFINTGGSASRRLGTDFDITFNEPSGIKKIFKLGDGYLYLTDDSKLKVAVGSLVFEIKLFDFFSHRINLSGEVVAEEVLRISHSNTQLLSSQKESFLRPVIDISRHNEGFYIIGRNQSRWLLNLEEDIIYVRPSYFDEPDRVKAYLRSIFFKASEPYNNLPNPFFVSPTNNLASVGDRIQLVVDSQADTTKGICRAWLNVNDNESLNNQVQVSPNIVGLRDFIGTPIAFNIIPSEIPPLSSANDYSTEETYSNHDTLSNLNSRISLHLETQLNNPTKVGVLSSFLFQRKYMIIPYEIVNPVGDSLVDRDEVYQDSSVTSPAVEIADIRGAVLDSAEIDEAQTNLVIGYNSSDGIVTSFERVLPEAFSYAGQVSIGGSFKPVSPEIIACGIRVNNDINTEALEMTPFIVFSRFSDLSKNTVSTSRSGSAYVMEVRQKGQTSWTRYVLDRSSIVAGVGVEYTARPAVLTNTIDFSGNWEMRIAYVNKSQIIRVSNYYDFESAVTRPSSSRVYANCIIMDIGVPSPVPNRIGGNNFDNGNNIASNIVIGLRDEFSSLTSLGFGAGISTDRSIFVQYSEINGSSNNLLGLLNNINSPDSTRLAQEVNYLLNSISPAFSIQTVLSKHLTTTFPDGFQYRLTAGFASDLYSGEYQQFNLRNEFEVLSNDSDVSISQVFASYDQNTIIAQTKAGVHEVAFDQVNANLRTREQTKSNIVLFLRKSVMLTEDNHIVVSTYSFDRFGYRTSIFGRFQKDLLDKSVEIVHNLRDRAFIIRKEDGTLVSFTEVDDQIVGYSKHVLEGFFVEKVFVENDLFHFYGYFKDSDKNNKYIFIMQDHSSKPYVDFRGLPDREVNIKSEMISNPIVFGDGVGPTGHLLKSCITDGKVFVRNIPVYKYQFSTESKKSGQFSSTYTDIGDLSEKITETLFTIQGDKDYRTRFHYIQDDSKTGGLLYGFQLKGDIG